MARGMRVVSVAAAVVMTAGLGFALVDPIGQAATFDTGARTVLPADGSREGSGPASRKDRAPMTSTDLGTATAAAGPAPIATTGPQTGGTDQATDPATTSPPTSAPTPTGSASSTRASRQSVSPAPGTTATRASQQSVSPAPGTTATTQQATSSPHAAPAAVAGGAGSLLHQSGLPWRSGVYMPGSDPRTFASFGAWRGRPLDVVVDWSARQTWAEIVDPDWLYEAWAQTPYTKALGVAMLPEGDGSATISRCAAGSYDDKWRQFGRNIAAAGLADTTVVRLGWEFNGNWYKWSAYDPESWAQCWREIVTAAEETAPALRWDWTVNRGVSAGLRDAREAWPGDAYVDIVGVDSYDMYPGVRSEQQWQQHYSGEFGLAFWADFARAHGKQLSVPEWGVYPGTLHAGNNGGDNPFYVGKMVEFFRSLGPLLAYEAYFNDSGSYYAGSLFGPVQAPQAAAEYRRLYAG